MFVAAYRRTMASAKRIIEDEDNPTPRRAKLIEQARAWQEKAHARQRRFDADQRAADETRNRLIAESPVRIPIIEIPTPLDIMQRVANWHGITLDELRGESREWPLIAARFDAIAAVYLNCRVGGKPPSLPYMARFFGQRHHTTILAALKKRKITRRPASAASASAAALPA